MMNRRHVELMVWALVMTGVAAEPAAASLDGSLQAIIGILKGPIARSCAIIAVMIIAYKMLFGNADPIKFGTVALAIGILFGAAELVDATIAS